MVRAASSAQEAEPLAGGDDRLDFHVEIWVRLPHEWSQTQRAELLGEELRRARELLAAGTIHRIWRVPGALHNVGIWRAATPDEIHDAITSLPCFPYLDAIVTALASHPAER